LSVAGVVSGILVRSFFVLHWTSLALVFIVLVGVVLLHKKILGQPHKIILLAVVFVLTFSFAYWRMDYEASKFATSVFHEYVNKTVTITGVIVREPDVRDTSQHLYIKTDYGLLLVIAERSESLSYADEVRVVGKISLPEDFVTDLGRTFNYSGYLEAKGVSHLMRYPESLEIVSTGNGNELMSWLFRAKQKFLSKLESILPYPEVGLAAGLLLGEKRALGEELNNIFRRTGIIHIVVLSGYNIMLVAAFFMFVSAYWFHFRWRFIVSIIGITLFALLVGLSATVLRASIMASLVLLGRAMSKSASIVRVLFLAGTVMLLFNPFLLVYDPGFQLSFLATLGLVFAAAWFEDKMTFVTSKGRVKEFVVATLVTQIAVLPLLLYQVGEFSVVAIVVNLLVLPMVAAAMLLTFVTGILAFVSLPLATVAGWCATLVLTYILWVAESFGKLPWSALEVPAFPFALVLILYATMIGLYWYLLNRDKDPLRGWQVIKEDELQIVGNEGDAKNKKTGSQKTGLGLDGDETLPIYFR